MTGNTLNEFMNDLLTVGGPEKEFSFRGKMYFLETTQKDASELLDLSIQEFLDNEEQTNINEFHFIGSSLRECVKKFEKARIFDGLDIYQAESEIKVLFG